MHVHNRCGPCNYKARHAHQQSCNQSNKPPRLAQRRETWTPLSRQNLSLSPKKGVAAALQGFATATWHEWGSSSACSRNNSSRVSWFGQMQQPAADLQGLLKEGRCLIHSYMLSDCCLGIQAKGYLRGKIFTERRDSWNNIIVIISSSRSCDFH